MHNVDLCQKGGTYAMTVGHCQNQLRVQGRIHGGGPGTKPPEDSEILHFLWPQNPRFPLLYVDFLDIKFYILDLLKCWGGRSDDSYDPLGYTPGDSPLQNLPNYTQ